MISTGLSPVWPISGASLAIGNRRCEYDLCTYEWQRNFEDGKRWRGVLSASPVKAS